MLKSLLPVGFVKLLGCVDNLVSVVLGGELECLSIVLLNEGLEVLANDLLVYKVLVLGNVGNFEQHS